MDATNAAVGILEMFSTWSASPTFLQDALSIAVFVVVVKFTLQIVNTVRRKRRIAAAVRTGRLFTSAQKDEGHKRAGGRCEFSNGMGRCKSPSRHGDHFYPYSKGGATSMTNFVASCEPHNLAKSAKLPSTLEKSRIEARRRDYFPRRVPVTAGEWA